MKILKQNQGFTLVEALVAITILMIGVVGPLGLAARGIADGFYIQNELAAKYLAQEGIELVVAQRLNNLQNGDPWTNCLPTGSNCGTVAALTSGPQSITLNGVSFTRTLALTEPPSNPAELIVSITMNWNNKATPRTYVISERLYSRP